MYERVGNYSKLHANIKDFKKSICQFDGAYFLITPFKELTISPKFLLCRGIYDTYEQVSSFSLGFA